MSLYLMLTKLTAEGARTLHSHPDRLKAVNEEVEELQCRVIEQYALLGPYDFATLVEASEDEDILQLSAALRSRGTMQIVTMPAFPVADFIGKLKRKQGNSTRPI